MSGWEVYKLKKDEKSFIVVGHGHRLPGKVWQGAMKGDVFEGLRTLQSPINRQRVHRKWEVEAPQRFGGADEANTGKNRKYLVFKSGTAASFVLRFEQTIPSELIRDLRVAFGGAKEQSHEEPASDPVLDPAGQAAGPRPRIGTDGSGNPAGPDEDPGHPGLEEGQQVVRRGRPKKTAKKATRRKANASR